MSVELQGKHLIAGEWVGDAESFTNMPVEQAADAFAVGRPRHVEQAAQAAEDAFSVYGQTSRAERAGFLRGMAEEIDARGDAITAIGTKETGLPAARLEGERGRTLGQLRLFADHIEDGAYLDRRHDPALPGRSPAPRPDLRVMQLPIGPVAVFGASNFPLAFSVAGGDTASALAAGCPVVVKGHPAHPGTGEIVAQAIDAAVRACRLPAGVFSLVQGHTNEVGEALVQHPLIRAVGFTGSLAGGRALFDLCAARPEPIPFFGEMGSINPVFALPAAVSARGAEIAKGWAASLTMGVGQFCTNPGIIFLVDGAEADAFTRAAMQALSDAPASTMLHENIASAYAKGCARVLDTPGVEQVVAGATQPRVAAADLYRTRGETFRANPALAEEVFGPFGLIVTVRDVDEMLAIAGDMRGQLTCTLQMDRADTDTARRLRPILERKAGRILADGFPTGVEVADAMVHGGPYPASTNFGHTSVGTLSIRRWLRPVCYQNIPEDVLPDDLK
jgi:2,5-dioxopentanoate dehydrogenase